MRALKRWLGIKSLSEGMADSMRPAFNLMAYRHDLRISLHIARSEWSKAEDKLAGAQDVAMRYVLFQRRVLLDSEQREIYDRLSLDKPPTAIDWWQTASQAIEMARMLA